MALAQFVAGACENRKLHFFLIFLSASAALREIISSSGNPPIEQTIRDSKRRNLTIRVVMRRSRTIKDNKKGDKSKQTVEKDDKGR
jgi:hypothetical protein